MSEKIEPEIEPQKKIYNKLVRDRIPEIISADGATCDIKTLEQEEYVLELARKLIEESIEFGKANDKQNQIKELADILEVVRSLMTSLEIKQEEVEAARSKRQEERGGFEKKIFLLSTEGGSYFK